MSERRPGLELSIWMLETGLSVKEFAAKVGCEPTQISRIRHGKARPSRSNAVRIEELTGGRVASSAWDA